MAKETTHITRYYDAVPPYGSAFKFLERKYESDTDKDHDVSYSKEHFELESSNPADTVKVATFLREKQYKPNENIKKDFYYVCEFTWQPYKKIKEYLGRESNLLEPIMSVEIVSPEEYMGDISGDINKRRGLVVGLEDLEARWHSCPNLILGWCFYLMQHLP